MYQNNVTQLEELEVSKTYDFTTQYIEGRLQKQLNSILQNAGEKTPMRIQVSSIELKDDVRKKGKGIAPFVILLPNSARAKVDEDKSNEINPIFESEERRERVRLRPEIYRMLSAYVYTKDDIHYLSQTRNRRAINLTHDHYLFMRQYSVIQPIKIGDTRMLMLLIDPIKVFHTILIDRSNPQQKFEVNIDRLVHATDKNFIYTVSRDVINSNRNGGMDELMSKLKRCISTASGV